MVHFAVDPTSAAMTTFLNGTNTRFLPFNQGHDLGAGNPPNPNGHQTAYLWEQVSRDAWMDVLSRFIHVEKPTKGSKKRPTVIFPRFHQWNAVRRLEADAKQNGAGSNYLIQHSAGSGKSNSIAWLAHRLASLHNNDDQKVFDKVVVITDRIILDRQLQETISQFEHAIGVVERIDEGSSQLAEALIGEQARIIISTLQKFPFIFDKIEELPDRNYAVIVDEAHSSQTGEAAKELRLALGAARPTWTTKPPTPRPWLQTVAVSRQPNLSFFAFTATPKYRTLELFGTRNTTASINHSTCTRCVMRASSRTCWPTTSPTSSTSSLRKQFSTIPITRPPRPVQRSLASSRCTPRTSLKRPRSLLSTSRKDRQSRGRES